MKKKFQTCTNHPLGEKGWDTFCYRKKMIQYKQSLKLSVNMPLNK